MPLPIVTVLHDGRPPPHLDRIRELAIVRPTRAGDLPETLRGSQALLAWDFRAAALADSWDAANELRWIHTASAGVDNVLTEEVLASDIVVTNSRGVFDAAIAEYVLGLVLMFAKDFPGSWQRQQERRWEHRDTETVVGRIALVVGVGPIGREIARKLRAVGMQVRGVGRHGRSGDPDFGDVAASEDLTQLLPEADLVVLAAPLTRQTRGMIDAAALAACKPSARLINVGRGELVVEDDLLAALRAGRLAGAALDVFGTEPLPSDSPWWDAPDTFVSPHMSADVVGWREALVDLFLGNLERWRAGQPLRNVVDKSAGYVTSPDSVTGKP